MFTGQMNGYGYREIKYWYLQNVGWNPANPIGQFCRTDRPDNLELQCKELYSLNGAFW